MLATLLLLLALFVINGLFAMSELAIVSARRARLAQMADSGSGGARQALALAAEPTRFLSSVQVGITCIGILSGALGEASIAAPIAGMLATVPVLAPHASTLAIVLMVIVLTFTSLIVGELVPKRIAMAHPEAVAAAMAYPLRVVGAAGRPLVLVLSATTDALLRLLRIRAERSTSVSVDEIRVLLRQGAEDGVVEPTEHELVTNVLALNDRTVGSVLTRRSDVVFLDVHASTETVRRTIQEEPHAVLPLCDGSLDHVVGFVRTSRVLGRMLDGEVPDLRALAEPAIFVPETTGLLTLLQQLTRGHVPVAVVVDEFGGMEGLVSLSDVTDALLGTLASPQDDDPQIVVREDGSWLVDGVVEIAALESTLGRPLLSDADRRRCHTVGGFVMLALGQLPHAGSTFTRSIYRFEVVDMDGRRVDKVVVSLVDAATAIAEG